MQDLIQLDLLLLLTPSLLKESCRVLTLLDFSPDPSSLQEYFAENIAIKYLWLDDRHHKALW
ncbi:MAG: hypothetical protein ACTS8R_06055 [Arsenophonus sp. NC-QC1-MAG3]